MSARRLRRSWPYEQIDKIGYLTCPFYRLDEQKIGNKHYRRADRGHMPNIDEKLQPILAEVTRRNAGEPEFHQAVHEVLESLGRVVAKHQIDRAPGQCALLPKDIEWHAWQFHAIF